MTLPDRPALVKGLQFVRLIGGILLICTLGLRWAGPSFAESQHEEGLCSSKPSNSYGYGLFLSIGDDARSHPDKASEASREISREIDGQTVSIWHALDQYGDEASLIETVKCRNGKEIVVGIRSAESTTIFSEPLAEFLSSSNKYLSRISEKGILRGEDNRSVYVGTFLSIEEPICVSCPDISVFVYFQCFKSSKSPEMCGLSSRQSYIAATIKPDESLGPFN
jgi:hypothetical protein